MNARRRTIVTLPRMSDVSGFCRRLMQTIWERCRRLMTEDPREARGRALLKEWLSAEQRRQFEATNSFEALGSHTGKRYRILYGTATNILELDEASRPVAGWCFIPRGYLVAGDVMLAQKIALETDEPAALAIARRFPIHATLQSVSMAASWREFQRLR
jgi:hypothetical protein